MSNLQDLTEAEARVVREYARAELVGAGELPALGISGTPPVPVLGEAYRWKPPVTGGAPPFSFRVVGLPSWLRFEWETGTLYADSVGAGAMIESTVTIIATDLTGAEFPLVITIPATGTIPVSGTALRAMNVNCYSTVGLKGIGAANRFVRTRLIHRAPVATEKMAVRLSLVFNRSTDNPIKDELVQSLLGMKMACLFEPNPVLAATGLTASIPFLFEGAKFKYFNPSGWDPNVWHLTSEELDMPTILGRPLAAGERFGSKTALVIDDNGGTQGNFIPVQRNVSNFIQRYTLVSVGATDIIGDGTGTFYGNSGYSAISTARTGSFAGFGPLDFLFRVPKATPSYWFIGDSITQEQKVGYGQPILFDVMGDADGNSSWAYIGAKRLGVMASGTGRGSDGEKYLRTADNWAGRRAEMVGSGCTEIHLTNGANDLTSVTAPAAWTVSTVLIKNAVRRTASGVYITRNAGTTGTDSGPVATVVGGTEVEGGVTWAYLGPYAADVSDNAYTLLGWTAEVCEIIRNDFTAAGKPVPPIRKMMLLPKGGTTTDNFATDGGTPIAGNPARVKQRALYGNSVILALVGLADAYSVAAGIETSQDSGIMLTNGTASYVMDPDKTHPVDQGHQNMADLLPGPLAVTPALLAA